MTRIISLEERIRRMSTGTSRSAALAGILNCRKPAGCTSRDVVNRIERLVRPVKVGHAGTLDPLAEGVLVIGMGAAVRLTPYMQRLPKEYAACFRLGFWSESLDIDSPLHAMDGAVQPTLEALQLAATRFLGRIVQTPPAFSAVKLGGRPAYRRARAGEAIRLPPRHVDVYTIEGMQLEGDHLRMTIRCGGGTYVRSLGDDLARAVGTRAVMTALARTAVGPFRIESSIDAQTADGDSIRTAMRPMAEGIGDLPLLRLSGPEIFELEHGRKLSGCLHGAPEAAVVDGAGRLRAIVVERVPGILAPYRVLPEA